METRKIGALSVSVVGLGCNNFGKRLDQTRTTGVVNAALDAGINFFDTADTYGGTKSEELLGQAIAGRRESLVVATKFGMRIDDQRPGGARPQYVRRALEDSLRRLRTDYIDLYQLHQPDADVPIAETLDALAELVQAGKVRELGCSNFSVEQIRQAQAAVKPRSPRFVSVQNEYSLLQREPEHGVLAECTEHGLAFLPYFPLASGMLTGKYSGGARAPANARLADASSPLGTRFRSQRNAEIVRTLTTFATARGHSLLELAFSWLLARSPVASVIAGATSPEQVRANVAAATWTLSADDLEELDRLAPRGPS
jgi:aryl-alcohol dehydrogenase-like predicted oxidoreductase